MKKSEQRVSNKKLIFYDENVSGFKGSFLNNDLDDITLNDLGLAGIKDNQVFITVKNQLKYYNKIIFVTKDNKDRTKKISNFIPNKDIVIVTLTGNLTDYTKDECKNKVCNLFNNLLYKDSRELGQHYIANENSYWVQYNKLYRTNYIVYNAFSKKLPAKRLLTNKKEK